MAGEVVKWLRVLDTLADDLGSVPSAHIGSLQSGIQHPFHAHMYIQNTFIHLYLFIIIK